MKDCNVINTYEQTWSSEAITVDGDEEHHQFATNVANNHENMLTSREVSTRLQHVPPNWELEVLYRFTRSSASSK